MRLFSTVRSLFSTLAILAGLAAALSFVADFALTYSHGGGVTPYTRESSGHYFLVAHGASYQVSGTLFWPAWWLERIVFGGCAALLVELVIEVISVLWYGARGLPPPQSAVPLRMNGKRGERAAAVEHPNILWSEPYLYEIRRLPRPAALYSWVPGRVVMAVFAFTAVIFASCAAAQYAAGQPHRAVAGLWSFAAIWLLVVVLAGAVGAACYLALVLAPAGVFIWKGKLLLEKPPASLSPDDIDRVVVEFPEHGYGIVQVHTRKGIRTVGIPAGTNLAELQNFLGEKVSVTKDGRQ